MKGGDKTDRELLEKIANDVVDIKIQMAKNSTQLDSHDKDIHLLKRGLLGTIAASVVGFFFK